MAQQLPTLDVRISRGCCGTHVPTTRGEEVFNVLTHGVGIPLAFVLCSGLLSLATNPEQDQTAYLYGAALFALFFVSSTYHMVCWYYRNDMSHPYVQTGQLFDRSMIFVFIAASYTPFLTVMRVKEENEALFNGVLCLVWAQAILGTIYTLFFIGTLERLELPMYIAMGGTALVCARPLYNDAPDGVITSLVSGGMAYLIGTYFYSMDRKIPYSHGVWHLFVVAGVVFIHAGIYLSYLDASEKIQLSNVTYKTIPKEEF